MSSLFHERGDTPAVRSKLHGRLHTQSWRALAPRAAEPAHTLGVAWVEGLLVGALAAEAPQPAWHSRDVLWIEPALAERDPRVLAMWLASGAVLAVDETRDGDDRRELAPTVLIASAEFYERLRLETTQRLERSALRTLSRWALQRPATWWARALILRPIADQLGLARVARVLTVDLPNAETRDWFRALGLPLESSRQEVTPLWVEAQA